MATVFLHIGRGKTGTTTIQHHMNAARERLREDGVHYVWADDCGSGTGHQNFAKSFIRDYPSYMIPATDPEQTKANVRAEIIKASAEKIVMSSENFTLSSIESLSSYFLEMPNVTAVKVILFFLSDRRMNSPSRSTIKWSRSKTTSCRLRNSLIRKWMKSISMKWLGRGLTFLERSRSFAASSTRDRTR